ncbi:MAG: cytochrome b/b6 domain-containing protein [Granulosicoccus sp.]
MSRTAGPTVFYTTLQRRLHWLVIILLLGQYLLQGPMRDAIAAIERQETLGFTQFLVTTVHTWSGIGIAALMLWRWQLRKRAVPLNGGHLSQKNAMWVAAHHVSMYAVTLAMVISGAMHYYLGWAFAARWHELGKWLLLALIIFHVAGALIHLRKGSTVLHRMMGRNSLR